MKNTATILQFQPQTKTTKPATRQKRIQNIDGIKYFSKSQIQLLRRSVRDQATVSTVRGNVTGVREWLVVDVLTSSGLRVAETANLRCGDLKSGYGQCALFVRDGKGGKSRSVQIPESLKKHLKSFLSWKRSQGEDINPDDFIFIGQRGPWSVQAIQQIVKKYLRELGLYEPGKAVHALRHSYAVELYRHEKDLRAVQKQLGHSSIQTTQIYTDVLPEDVQRQVKGLWGG